MRMNTLSDFYNSTVESPINEAMLSRTYILPVNKIKDSLGQLVEIPCFRFVDHLINEMARIGVTSNDVPQFSSWDDGTERICRAIVKSGDSGFRHEEIGRLLASGKCLHNKEDDRKYIIACRKYGEGHAKLAKSLGLLQEIDKTYFLSCLGACWPDVPQEIKDRLYTRMILRTRFIGMLIQRASSEMVCVKEITKMLGLSRWSIYRRHSNVVALLERLKGSREYDFSALLAKIETESMLDMRVEHAVP